MLTPKAYNFLPVAGIFLRWSIRMCNNLDLDERQKQEARGLFDAIRRETDEEYRAMRERKLDRVEARNKMIEIYLNYCDKFSNLLHEEQNKKLRNYGWMSWDRPDDNYNIPEQNTLKICA
jgi:hypothetical protein